MGDGLAEMRRALGYLIGAQEDQRRAEELLTRAHAGRAMAMRLVKVSIERSARRHRGEGVVARVRRFGEDDTGERGTA